MLRWLELRELTALEEAVFALPLGLGILAYGVLDLGLLGLLHSWALSLRLVAVGIMSWPEWSEIWGRLPSCMSHQLQGFRQVSGVTEGDVGIVNGAHASHEPGCKRQKDSPGNEEPVTVGEAGSVRLLLHQGYTSSLTLARALYETTKTKRHSRP